VTSDVVGLSIGLLKQQLQDSNSMFAHKCTTPHPLVVLVACCAAPLTAKSKCIRVDVYIYIYMLCSVYTVSALVVVGIVACCCVVWARCLLLHTCPYCIVLAAHSWNSTDVHHALQCATLISQCATRKVRTLAVSCALTVTLSRCT
jgi:Ca2+/Na+ antiporter